MVEPVRTTPDHAAPFVAQARRANFNRTTNHEAVRKADQRTGDDVRAREARTNRGREAEQADRTRQHESENRRTENRRAENVPAPRRQAAPARRGNFIDVLA